MSRMPLKNKRRMRRKQRVRKKIYGTAECPRLTVFRSLKNIYAQIIDDDSGRTLVQASTQAKDVRGELSGHGGNVGAAQVIGKVLGQRAVEQGITTVAFDRNGYRFHGRVKALADAAREAGLKF